MSAGARSARAPVVLATLTLLGACAASPGPDGPVAPAPLPKAQPRATPPDPPIDEIDDAAARVARALARVAVLRGLAPKRPVPSRTLPRDELTELVRRHVSEKVPPETLLGSTELLVGLGVVPVDFDYEGAFLAFMTAELAGLYDPESATMYLAADLDPMAADATLTHELVHALQDQHYDLAGHLDYRQDGGDAQAAVHALAEGDATSLMLDALLEDRGATALDMPESFLRMQILASVEMSPAIAAVPAIIRRSAVASYMDGTAFVHRLRAEGGWAQVDAIWARPPETTEQLLHPEKLAAREPAEIVAVPGAPRETGWQPVYVDVMGEQALRLLFEEWVPARTAAEASGGWGGDRVAVYRSESEVAVAHVIRWDDEAGARRGHETIVRGVLASEDTISRDAAEAAIRRGPVCRERSDLGPFATARRGREVAIVAGPYHRDGSRVVSRGSCVGARRWLQGALGK
jgi:hypothetical protein